MNTRILNTIATLTNISVEKIDINDTLVSLGINSLTKVELIISLEEEFNIVFEDASLDPEKLIKVIDIIKLTEKFIN